MNWATIAQDGVPGGVDWLNVGGTAAILGFLAWAIPYVKAWQSEQADRSERRETAYREDNRENRESFDKATAAMQESTRVCEQYLKKFDDMRCKYDRQ